MFKLDRPSMKNTSFTAELSYAARRYFQLHKQRDEAGWARGLITATIGLVFPSLYITLALLFGSAKVTAAGLGLSWLNGLFIAFLIHGAYRLVELTQSQARLDALQQGGWRAGLFFSLLPVICILLGMWLFALGLGWWTQQQVWTPLDSTRGLSQFLFISLVGVLIGWALDHQVRRRQALELQATEARLLHLQAQIEPHFLFNSLAAVQSLIKPAPDRALAMLEHFTDHLRASLAALREDSCELGTELQAVRSYLALMQFRMGDRLRFAVEAEPAAEQLRLPPLLIQPLIENAIVHGIEPKDEGGEVRLRAWIEGSTLKVRVQDDGLGLLAKPRRSQQGHGIALKNVRERLAARYGERASLDLHIDEAGCRALLSLPINTKEQGSAA